MREASTASNGQRTAWILASVAFLLYANTLRNGYALDDYLLILQNSHIGSGFSGIPALLVTNFSHGVDGFNDGLYRPLAPVTFAIEHALFGFSPLAGHLVNVLIFAATVALLYFLLLRLFRGSHFLLPLTAALLFLFHPIHTEAVANVKGRDELLAFLNFVAAALFIFRYEASGRPAHLALSVLFFILSFLSKESAVTAAAVIPLMLFVFSGMKGRRIIAVALVFACTAAALSALRYSVVHSMEREVDAGLVSLLNNSMLEADGLAGRLATGAWFQAVYAWKLLFPFSLSHDYSYNALPALRLADPKALPSLAGVAGALAWGMVAAKRKSAAGFGVLYHFITLSVVANVFLLIGATFAERFLYMPSLGFSMLASAMLCRLVKAGETTSIAKALWLNRAYTLVLALILLPWAAQTVARNAEWKDNATLFSADVQRVSGSARIHYNYGTEMYRRAAAADPADRAALTTAISHLTQAVRIYPAYLDAWCNIGLSYALAGSRDTAVACYRRALAVDPGYSKAWYNMALAYFGAKDHRNALDGFLKYLQFRPDHAQANHYAGLCYGYMQQAAQGVPYLQRAHALDPQNFLVLKDLGVAYGFMGDYNSSLQHSLKALALQPGDKEILLNIALSYRALGDEGNYGKYMEMAGR